MAEVGVMLDIYLLQPPQPGFVCRSCLAPLSKLQMMWRCTAGLWSSACYESYVSCVSHSGLLPHGQ